MSGDREKFATLDSDTNLSLAFPYNGPNSSRIHLRQSKEGTTAMIAIDKGQILCHRDPCNVQVRFDEGKAENFSGHPSADHDSRFLFLTPAPRLIAKIKKSKKMLVQILIYQDGNNILEFQTAGLKW